MKIVKEGNCVKVYFDNGIHYKIFDYPKQLRTSNNKRRCNLCLKVLPGMSPDVCRIYKYKDTWGESGGLALKTYHLCPDCFQKHLKNMNKKSISSLLAILKIKEKK